LADRAIARSQEVDIREWEKLCTTSEQKMYSSNFEMWAMLLHMTLMGLWKAYSIKGVSRSTMMMLESDITIIIAAVLKWKAALKKRGRQYDYSSPLEDLLKPSILKAESAELDKLKRGPSFEEIVMHLMTDEVEGGQETEPEK